MSTKEMRFAGVQVVANEDVKHAIWSVMNAADTRGLRFERLELFGELKLGRFSFARFRSDCEDYARLGKLLLDAGRGVILADVRNGYRIILPSGQEGRLRIAIMQSTALPGFPVSYRGPRIKFWTRQFDDLAIQSGGRSATVRVPPDARAGAQTLSR